VCVECSYLDPRSHRNARACSFAARLTRSDDLLQQGTRELCALARSVEQVAEPLALSASRYGTRYAKWAGGSRSQTHRRAAKGGFTQDDVKVRRPRARSQPPVLFFCCEKLCLFVGPKTNPDPDTGTAPIPPVTVLRVKAYSGGVLARALSEGLRYLST